MIRKFSDARFKKEGRKDAYLIRYRIGVNSEKSFNNFTTLACVKCTRHFVRKWRWLKIDRRKVLILLSIVIAVAIIGGIVLNAYSTANAQTTVKSEQGWNFGAGWFIGNISMGMHGMPHGGMRGRGCFGYGFIEVSEEFKQNVINIAQNDADVQNLLNEGYNITAVKPIIKTIVEGDGTVVTKATSAILMLEKDTTGRASVWVDLEQEKVTRIEILTITVIEKP
ncbi:MAG: hypothetical protein QHH12_07725 [Candidatus Bathyarchaeota archaeon]|nr:hypothetical protein [Candidatus Bathyarchaeota archaeon A05DMB-3]MDH7607627.1 hypothetical protein [Candidatus Bathyarchaeota archaeon]